MNDYISVPKRSVLSALALLIVGAFTYYLAIRYLIPSFQEILNLEMETFKITSIYYLIWVLTISYGLIGVMICFTVNIFKKLKSYHEDGFIKLFIRGLMWGHIIGLMLGLFGGVILEFSEGQFLEGLIKGFIMGFIIGPLGGFFGGLLVGLLTEFEK